MERTVLYIEHAVQEGEVLLARKNLGIFRKDSAFRSARKMKGPCQIFVPSLGQKMRQVCTLGQLPTWISTLSPNPSAP